MKLTKNARGNTFLPIAAVLSGVCALQEVNGIVFNIRHQEFIEMYTLDNLIASAVMICLAVISVLILLGRCSAQWLGLPLSLYWAADVANYLIAFSSPVSIRYRVGFYHIAYSGVSPGIFDCYYFDGAREDPHHHPNDRLFWP